MHFRLDIVNIWIQWSTTNTLMVSRLLPYVNQLSTPLNWLILSIFLCQTTIWGFDRTRIHVLDLNVRKYEKRKKLCAPYDILKVPIGLKYNNFGEASCYDAQYWSLQWEGVTCLFDWSRAVKRVWELRLGSGFISPKSIILTYES